MSLTPEQLELRRTGIGASEIAALAGLSKWATPIQIYEAKRTGHVVEANVAMELGTLLEEPIAQLYRKRTGRFVLPVYTLRHPSKRYAIATPDRAAFVTPPAIGEVEIRELNHLRDAEKLVQIKSTSWRLAREWGMPGTDEVPEDYLAQATWEMGVAGVPCADFAVLFDKDRFELFTVHFSLPLFEGLYEIAARFMRDHVEAGVPPAPDASKQYAEFLGRAFPRETSEDIAPVDAPDVVEAVRTYALLKLVEKRTELAIQKVRNLITGTIGNRTGILTPLGRVTWKKERDSEGVNWQAAANDARTLALLLLQRFGDQLPAPERDDLVAKLRQLEAEHRCLRKRGARKIHCRWEPSFKRALPAELARAVEWLRIAGDEEEVEDVGVER